MKESSGLTTCKTFIDVWLIIKDNNYCFDRIFFKQIYSVSKASLYHTEKWFCCWKFLYMLNGFINFTCIKLIHLYFRELRCAFCKVIKWIIISNQFESRLRLNSQTCWGGFPGWGINILLRGSKWPFRLTYVESRPVFSLHYFHCLNRQAKGTTKKLLKSVFII